MEGELVDLVAAELLPLDLQVARGLLPSVRVADLPAGQVAVGRRRSDAALVSVQAGRSGWGLGAPVGTFATSFPRPADVVCARLPDGLDPLVAAAGTSSVLAARLALEAAECTPEDTVLVTGSSGAVGSAAVQLARARGCQVLTHGRGEPVPPGASVVVDCAAGPQLADIVRTAAPGARHVVVGYAGDGMTTFPLPLLLLGQHRLQGFNVYQVGADAFARGHEAALRDLAAGTVTVPEGRRRTVALSRAAAAYEAGDRVLLVPDGS